MDILATVGCVARDFGAVMFDPSESYDSGIYSCFGCSISRICVYSFGNVLW